LIELNQENCEKLVEQNYEVIKTDFLLYNSKTFDKIVANPPFSKSQDVKHILHMYELLNE
jgi:16S rRNA G1207 methylase RsmC